MLSGTVVVTGGTGFIGGRIVERLALETRAEVRVLLRSFSTAARVARFPVEMLQLDLSDHSAVAEAVKGADVVINAAFDGADLGFNLKAARALARACLIHGVSRFVHLSTFSVYGPLPVGEFDEDFPRNPCDSPYAEVKIAIEDELTASHGAEGLPVVILQPTIVYGPFADTWTIGQVQKLRRGRFVLPDEGRGLCNAVFVDDVASAVFRAAVAPGVVGDRFLISGERAVTWRRFFEYYENMLGVRSLQFMNSDEIARTIGSDGPVAIARRLRRDPHRILDYDWAKVLYRGVRRLFGETRWSRVRRSIPPHVALPDAERLDLYRARAVVNIDRARAVLGWEPEYDLDQGMELTGEYIRWARL